MRKSDEALAGEAAQGSRGQTENDAAIVADTGAERKVFTTAAASAAQAGFGLYELSNGAFLLTRAGLARELPDLGAVRDLLRQLGARA